VFTCLFVVAEPGEAPSDGVAGVGFAYGVVVDAAELKAAGGVFDGFSVVSVGFPCPCEVAVGVGLVVDVVMSFSKCECVV
jgi:hypothetical protein